MANVPPQSVTDPHAVVSTAAVPTASALKHLSAPDSAVPISPVPRSQTAPKPRTVLRERSALRALAAREMFVWGHVRLKPAGTCLVATRPSRTPADRHRLDARRDKNFHGSHLSFSFAVLGSHHPSVVTERRFKASFRGRAAYFR